MALATILTLIIIVSMVFYHNSSQDETVNRESPEKQREEDKKEYKKEDKKEDKEEDKEEDKKEDKKEDKEDEQAANPEAEKAEAEGDEPGKGKGQIQVEKMSEEDSKNFKEGQDEANPYIVVDADFNIVNRSKKGAGVLLEPWGDYMGWGGDISIPVELELFNKFTKELPKRDELDKARKNGDFQTIHNILGSFKDDKKYRVPARSALKSVPSVQKANVIIQDAEVIRNAFKNSQFNEIKLKKINQNISKIRNNLLWGEPRRAKRIIDELNTSYTPAKGIKQNGVILKDQYRVEILITSQGDKQKNKAEREAIKAIKQKLKVIAENVKTSNTTQTLGNLNEIYNDIKSKVVDCNERDKLFGENLKYVNEFRNYVKTGGSGRSRATSQRTVGGNASDSCSNEISKSVKINLDKASEEVDAKAAEAAAEAEAASKKAAAEAEAEAASKKAAAETEAASKKKAADAEAAAKEAAREAAAKAEAAAKKAATQATEAASAAKTAGKELWARATKMAKAATDEAVKGATALKDAGVKALEERKSRNDNLDILKKALLEECDAEKITVYVIGVDEIPSEISDLASRLNQTDYCKKQTGNGIRTGGRYIDFKLSKANIETLENFGLYNSAKFIRYKYLTKEGSSRLETKFRKDFLLTTIISIILQIFGKGKLALGFIVDQLMSMTLYWKYKHSNFLLIPYYILFL